MWYYMENKKRKKYVFYICVAVAAFTFGVVHPLWGSSHSVAQSVVVVPYEVTTEGQVVVGTKKNIYRSVSQEFVGKYTVLAPNEAQKIAPYIEVDRDANSMQPTVESLRKIAQSMRKNNIEYAVMLFENQGSIEQTGNRHGALGVQVLQKNGEIISDFQIPYSAKNDQQYDTTVVAEVNSATTAKIGAIVAEKSKL